MAYFTSNTYALKRDILTFSNKISRKLSKPDRKFTADMTYGILASGSSHKGESAFLLLPAGKRRHWHTLVCQRGRQALVPDKASGIPSTLP